jgi:two-component system response regulator PilR (NtrC family)
MKALVVDDEKNIRQVLKVVLEDFEFDVLEASSVKEAMDMLKNEPVLFALVDLKLPDGTGMDILRFINERGLSVESVIITAFASSNTAVEAMKLGAYDYITKPFNLAELKLIVRNVKEKLVLEEKLQEKEEGESEEFVGNSPIILKLKETIKKIAPYDVDVLIVGESGTGKEVVARKIHRLSKRNRGPFVAINCASLPSELLESELFGYKKGAFTGATSNRIGL